jgi:hypothetical protein
MRARNFAALVLAACAVVACGRSNNVPPPPPLPPSIDDAQTQESGPAEPGPVDAALLATPNSEFVAIEPSEVGVAAAPDIREAISAITANEGGEDQGTLSLTIREAPDAAVVDIVRDNLPDDSVAAGQVRIEFQKQAEGWFPTNAYRRNMCRRGAYAMQWTKDPCP